MDVMWHLNIPRTCHKNINSPFRCPINIYNYKCFTLKITILIRLINLAPERHELPFPEVIEQFSTYSFPPIPPNNK